MTEADFPALYQDANRTSVDTQRRFLFATKCVILGSLVTAGLGMMGEGARVIGTQIFAAVIVLLASCYLLFGRPQKVWYATRALAESVKTISWRYVARAEPFEMSTAQAAVQFRKTVHELLRANDEASALRYASASSNLISAAMDSLRESNLDLRRSIYLKRRIDDQLTWYGSKSKWNDRRSKFWYGVLITSGLSALVLSLARLTQFHTPPVDWLFSIPTAVLSWIQIKRYQELASSYNLTAHEIMFAKNALAQANDESAFAHFVADTENAFSREHTQWYARKDLS